MSIQKTTTELETLKINYLTQEMYEDALENGEINEGELYFTPDSNPQMLTTSVSLPVANWSNNSQTVSISSITSSSIIFTSPAPASYDEYVINHVRCTGQGDGTLTFSCDFIPDAAITINMMIFD